VRALRNVVLCYVQFFEKSHHDAPCKIVRSTTN